MAVDIHPNALVESTDIGDGTVVWAFAHILNGAVVGEDCKIGDHCFIESGAVLGDRVTVKNSALIWHGVTIADDVFIGPNVVFTNDLRPRAEAESAPEDWLPTEVARGASIGANSTILAGIRIGACAMIGAGSVVVADVPDHALVYGNDATQRGWVCRCGERLAEPRERCSSCGRRYRVDGTGVHPLDDEHDAAHRPNEAPAAQSL